MKLVAFDWFRKDFGSRKTQDRLSLKFIPYTGNGLNTHFYHFFLSYFLPLSILMRSAKRTVAVVENSGPMNSWLREFLPRNRLIILGPRFFRALNFFALLRCASHHLSPRELWSRTNKELARDAAECSAAWCSAIQGLVGFEENRPKGDFLSMMQEVDEIKKGLGCKNVEEIAPRVRPRVVIIDRRTVPRHYLKRESRGYGPTRRSIPNFRDLGDYLTLHADVEIVATEELSHSHLIRLLAGSDVLVAQHGAGLVNMLWLPKWGRVVEIADEEPSRTDFFGALASRAGLIYELIIAQEGPHAPIDVKQVGSRILAFLDRAL